MEKVNARSKRGFCDSSFVKKSLVRLDLGSYWLWAALRVVLTLLPQTGYIHPDEYFQTVEVFAGDVFETDVSLPWEFNRTFPIRSIPVIYSTIFVPFSLLRSASQILDALTGLRILTPYALLVIPRLAMCCLSFVSDYCLYRICYLFGQNYKERLIIFSSSYITLTFMTRTFTNSVEVTLFNVLLLLVASCIAESEKTLYQEGYLKRKYNEARSIADRVKINKLMKMLPKHSLRRCVPIAAVTVAGVFNRPTFVFYAVTPLFSWFERGLTPRSFVRDFHARMFAFVAYCCPVACLFVLVDSAYYGYITWGEIINNRVTLDNFVVTPLNFVRYNLDSSNLSKHGLHPRFLHALVNIPLLFNVLGISGLVVLVKLVIRGSLSWWTLLPKSQSITGMMTIAFLAPLLLLSAFPHQEPRFLTPLIVPLVFLYSHLIRDFEEECKTVAPYERRFPRERTARGIFGYPLKCVDYVEKMTRGIDNRYNINGRYLASIKRDEVVRRREDCAGAVPPDDDEEDEEEEEEEVVEVSRRCGRGRQSRLTTVWHVANVACLVFFGFVHQGGIYGLTKHLHVELSSPKPRYTTYHLVTSHIYSLPLHLLMLDSASHANFHVHELGSQGLDRVHAKLADVLRADEVAGRRRSCRTFYALPASAFREFRSSLRATNYTYDVVDVFYPHFSSEALPNFAVDAADFARVGDGVAGAANFACVRYALEFLQQFGLMLLRVKPATPE